MARTPSTMVPLGTPMPRFRLPDPATGRLVADRDLTAGAPAVVVAFICNHCPFVKHVAAGLAELGRFCAERGVPFVAISSNDPIAYPDDAPQRMVEERAAQGWEFPYLFDESQEVARAFDAACTPDFFVYDREGRLAYRGQMDDSRPGNGVPVTGNDLRAAIDAVLAGRPAPEPQKPSIGCNIKWR